MVEVDKLQRMVEQLRLDGRVVIVTGASRGIGAAVARLAAGLGAHVVGVARSADAVRGVLADLPTESRPSWGMSPIRPWPSRPWPQPVRLGRVWGLVNNAGIGSGYKPATDTTLSEWDEVMRVNLMGAVSFARAVGSALVAAGGGGRIINVSSIAGQTGLPNIAPYNVTKAALDALTRTMAVELARGHFAAIRSRRGRSKPRWSMLLTANPALKERFILKTPLGRVGT